MAMNRQTFIRAGMSCAAGSLAFPGLWNSLLEGAENRSLAGVVRTVTGDIAPGGMGIALPHEHVMCDFIGADKVTSERYDPDEVVRVMLPLLKELRKTGVRTFIDCTPAFIGRDPEILFRLSKASGLYILTNTGLYKEPFLPRYAWAVSDRELADMWTREITEGIGETGIRAGFIKIAVNPGPLVPIQKKIVAAACLTHKLTGAVICSHTASGAAALEQLGILEREKVDPSAFIFAHAGNEKDQTLIIKAAKRGAWIEYDTISGATLEKNLELVRSLLDNGHENNLLLSQDSGWYNVGEPGGGQINGYTCLVREFLPKLEQAGVSKELVRKLTVENPARAFTLRG